jgi:opacity protein-like surface antigen
VKIGRLAGSGQPFYLEEYMSIRRVLLVSSFAVLTFAAAPRRASADWYLTPFIGGNFAGNANFGGDNSFDDQVERRVDVGASLGWMGKGIAGFEVDWGWSPNFFQNTAAGNFAIGDSNVTTLMGNVIVGIPIGGQTGGGVRPYATGGVGLIRSNISGSTFFNDLHTNDFGFDAGGGVQGYFNDHVGLRGDLRYFRSLQNSTPSTNSLDLSLADFNYWRATVGVMFRFGN